METIQRSLHDVGRETFSEFLHSCVDDICKKKLQHNYDSFKSCTNWSQDEYNTLHTTFKKLIFDVIEEDFPEKKIVESCTFLSTDHVQCLVDCLVVRKHDIENLLLCKGFSVAGPKLHDYDWKLKWVMGSSSLCSFREPLLLIDFIMSEDEVDTRNISLELNRSELKMLLRALEKAQEQLKS